MGFDTCGNITKFIDNNHVIALICITCFYVCIIVTVSYKIMFDSSCKAFSVWSGCLKK